MTMQTFAEWLWEHRCPDCGSGMGSDWPRSGSYDEVRGHVARTRGSSKTLAALERAKRVYELAGEEERAWRAYVGSVRELPRGRSWQVWARAYEAWERAVREMGHFS